MSGRRTPPGPTELGEPSFEAALRDPFVWRQAEGVWFACRLDDRSRVEVLNTPAGPVEWPITDEEAEALFDAAASVVAEREPCDRALLAAFAEVAQRLREDRATAPERVNRLLDMDPSGWRPLLQHEPSYWTVGVVEGILASVEKTAHLTWRCFELTTLATEIVPLMDGSWPVVIRAQVSAEAWREHAWALLNLGRYPAAEDAARRAFAQLADQPALAIDRALAQYVEATAVLRQGRPTTHCRWPVPQRRRSSTSAIRSATSRQGCWRDTRSMKRSAFRRVRICG